MNKRKLEKFKKSYEQERNALMRKINSEDNELDCDGDETDLAQSNALANIQKVLTNREMLRLNKLEAALKKIEDGTFGRCEECGELIGEKRLEAIPGVLICLSCAELEERTARNFSTMSNT